MVFCNMIVLFLNIELLCDVDCLMSIYEQFVMFDFLFLKFCYCVDSKFKELVKLILRLILFIIVFWDGGVMLNVSLLDDMIDVRLVLFMINIVM